VSDTAILDRATFVARFGGIFEHAPWIAAAAYEAILQERDLPEAPLTAEGLHARMVAALRNAAPEQKRALIAAHPDLAGRLAQAGRLTAASTQEQASAGLDQLTDAERARFTELNEAYKARFGLPFVMAVKGRGKAEILAAFERRLDNSREQEFATALAEIEKIALLRLKEVLP
jgi:OHCU decarboxylase